jgi:hypothetical protein
VATVLAMREAINKLKAQIVRMRLVRQSTKLLSDKLLSECDVADMI